MYSYNRREYKETKETIYYSMKRVSENIIYISFGTWQSVYNYEPSGSRNP